MRRPDNDLLRSAWRESYVCPRWLSVLFLIAIGFYFGLCVAVVAT